MKDAADAPRWITSLHVPVIHSLADIITVDYTF